MKIDIRFLLRFYTVSELYRCQENIYLLKGKLIHTYNF